MSPRRTGGSDAQSATTAAEDTITGHDRSNASESFRRPRSDDPRQRPTPAVRQRGGSPMLDHSGSGPTTPADGTGATSGHSTEPPVSIGGGRGDRWAECDGRRRHADGLVPPDRFPIVHSAARHLRRLWTQPRWSLSRTAGQLPALTSDSAGCRRPSSSRPGPTSTADLSSSLQGLQERLLGTRSLCGLPH